MSKEKFCIILALFALIDIAAITITGRDITRVTKFVEGALWIAAALFFYFNK